MDAETVSTVETEEVKIQGVSFLRHSDWIGPEDFVEPINIIGIGAVGSTCAILAARMGAHKFRVWDADFVEPHNLANQIFDHQHIGMRKVDAIKDVLTRFNPAIRVDTYPEFFTAEKYKGLLIGPVIIATDSMASRADLHDAFRFNVDVEGVFETRLGFDYGEVHIVDPMNLSEVSTWRKTLVDDKDVPEGPCNRRICTTLVQLTSAYAVHMLCSRYAALRQHIPWEYTPRTLFSLNNKLRLVSTK